MRQPVHESKPYVLATCLEANSQVIVVSRRWMFMARKTSNVSAMPPIKVSGAPANDRYDDSIHRTRDKRSDQSAPSVRPEPDGDAFPARQQCRQDEVALRHA